MTTLLHQIQCYNLAQLLTRVKPDTHPILWSSHVVLPTRTSWKIEGTSKGCTVEEQGFNEPSSTDINPSPPQDRTSASYPVPGLSYPKSFEDKQAWRALRQGNLDDRVSNLAALRYVYVNSTKHAIHLLVVSNLSRSSMLQQVLPVIMYAIQDNYKLRVVFNTTVEYKKRQDEK